MGVSASGDETFVVPELAFATAAGNAGNNFDGMVTSPVSSAPAFDLSGDNLFEEIGKLIVDKLPDPVDGGDQKDVFNDIESGVVLAALKRTRGNKQAAANLLGLYRPRLYGMIKRHNLEDRV
jgi:transcriptional regulator of acetoin/glycerol metabolism